MVRTRGTLTRQELAIMKIVWRTGAVTVRDVYEALRARRQVAYTTVMTMMNILETKGYLKKEKFERAFRYRPARQERTVVTSMVRDFVNRVFDGASHPLLLHLVREGRLSDEERRELMRLIREAKEE
jgi:BlaI family transcriptional regulator, penicillinase repressor